MSSIRVNGVARPSVPKAGNLVVDYDKARRLILAAESSATFRSEVEEELPAIVTHWLQAPKETPPMLSREYADKWIGILREYCLLKDRSPSLSRVPKIPHPRPVHIDFASLPFPPVTKPDFTFIDLFAGIGGFRIALQESGGKCVFSSEWDKAAKETYYRNYGEVPFGDIRKFTSDKLSDSEIDRLIPDHDVLAGGFPCQPFSRAGVSARESLGKAHGFSCDIQGTLFFDIVRIAKAKRPKVLLLENVQNLRSHDGGETFETIRRTIEQDLGYSFADELIDASVLVPQKRKRCYMVCLRDKKTLFTFPEFKGEAKQLKSILEKSVPAKYTISDKLWQGHINRSARNVSRGAGFTAYEVDLEKPSHTLVARYGKDGKECLIPQSGKNPRKLTPRECARLQGFPERFKLPDSDSPSYKQFGNSVAVPVVKKIAQSIIEHCF